MKKLLFLILSALTFAACDFEPSRNGDLDGFWQLHRMDTLATGGSADMRLSGIYWAVQGHLLELTNVKGSAINVLFRFRKEPSSLTIYNPVCDNRALSDSIVTTVEPLLPYGILHLEEVFQIQSFSSEEMVLVNDLYRFSLRKY